MSVMATLALAVPWLGSVALALLAASLAYAFGVRRERAKERRARTLVAAGELAGAIRNLQGVLRRHGRDAMPSDEVSAAFTAWADSCDRHSHRLPGGYRHIARSVRDATGTVCGGISMVHLRPDSEQLGLADPHAI